MRDLFTNPSYTIGAGQTRSGIAHEALTLRVEHGRAWVTVEGASHDYWMAPGCELQLTPGQLTVIEADPARGEVELRIERPQSRGAALAANLMTMAYRLGRRAMARKTAQASLQCGAMANCK